MGKGIDVFTHDAVASEGSTLKVLRGIFGNDGYAFWFITLEYIAQSENMRLDLHKRTEWLRHVARCGVSEETAKNIVGVLCDLGAIDSELWKNKKIIWSDAFVERAKAKLSRRQAGVPDKPEPVKDATEDKFAHGFEAFWEAYPRKIGKGEAFKKYKARRSDGYSDDELLRAAKTYANQCRTNRTEKQYIKHPRTFLSDTLPFTDFLQSEETSSNGSQKNPFGDFSIPREYMEAVGK